jgi:uncharacterized membrane protein YphA (DoxX/SURF4 family)
MLRLTTLNLSNPVGQAFWILRVVFTVGPIMFGLDKFSNVMVQWSDYLAPWIPNLIHVSPQTFMYGVGVIEIAAGILVGLWPQYFAYFVTLWLLGVIVNLLSTGQHFDIVLRDFGLSMSVLGLGRLGAAHQLEKHGPVEIETVNTQPSVEPRPREASRPA